MIIVLESFRTVEQNGLVLTILYLIHLQVVRTIVVLLHRQWLKTKGRGSHTLRNRTWTSPGLQVLREALMLLHWLLLKDSSFSEHCLDVLHMYDQVIPAIRDTFRLVPDLSESEGGFTCLYSVN